MHRNLLTLFFLRHLSHRCCCKFNWHPNNSVKFHPCLRSTSGHFFSVNQMKDLLSERLNVLVKKPERCGNKLNWWSYFIHVRYEQKKHNKPPRNPVKVQADWQLHCEVHSEVKGRDSLLRQHWAYLWRVVAFRRPPGRLIIGFVHQDIPKKKHPQRNHRVNLEHNGSTKLETVDRVYPKPGSSNQNSLWEQNWRVYVYMGMKDCVCTPVARTANEPCSHTNFAYAGQLDCASRSTKSIQLMYVGVSWYSRVNLS